MATVLDSTALSSQDKCAQAIEIEEDFSKMNCIHRAVVVMVINVSYRLLSPPPFKYPCFVILINVVQAQDFSRFMG